jgi:hypothetical protein
MKKRHVFLIFLLLLLGAGYFYILPEFVIRSITLYDTYTFPKVLNDPELREKYGIGDKSSPKDYGYDFEEINYRSIYDSLHLNGWWVATKFGSSKTIVLVHGRTSNRLKTLKYLALIDQLKLDTAYNVMIPDLRNSGKSEPAPTYMGNKFSEDLAATILEIKNRYDQDTIVLYGFSMGAMASMNMLSREDLVEKMNQNNIHFEYLILDSPLCNVYETTLGEAEKMGLTEFLFKKGFDKFNDETNDRAGKMNMHYLLEGNEIPLLVLQSTSDKTTPVDIFKMEWVKLNTVGSKSVVYFEGPEHVQLFQDSATHKTYIEAVRQFFESNAK